MLATARGAVIGRRMTACCRCGSHSARCWSAQRQRWVPPCLGWVIASGLVAVT